MTSRTLFGKKLKGLKVNNTCSLNHLYSMWQWPSSLLLHQQQRTHCSLRSPFIHLFIHLYLHLLVSLADCLYTHLSQIRDVLQGICLPDCGSWQSKSKLHKMDNQDGQTGNSQVGGKVSIHRQNVFFTEAQALPFRPYNCLSQSHADYLG